MNKKLYVFPKCKEYELEINKMEGLARLYAFPNKPTINKYAPLVILDSGAYNIYSNGGYIDAGYMVRLSNHYKKYDRENVICVAPDVFLNPQQSMFNMYKWFDRGLYPQVAAVIQAERKGYIDINNLIAQVDYYINFTCVMFFSNNGLTGKLAKSFKLEKLFKYMKDKGVKWIHVLGAGWSEEDIKDWKSIKYFDSLDSIAYYSTEDKNEFGSLHPITNIEKILTIMEEGDNYVY